MKKWIKISLFTGMVLAAALMLCSCKALDEAKLNHAVYTDNTKKTIEFRGKTYQLYAIGGKNGAIKDNYTVITDGRGLGYVTAPDVPVLLADHYGNQIQFSGSLSDTPVVLVTYSGASHYTIDSLYFVQTGYEDAFTKALDQVKMDHYYLDVFTMDLDTDSQVTTKTLLGEKETAVIQRTLKRPFDPATDFNELKEIEHLSRFYLTPNCCDQTMTFSDFSVVQIVRTTEKDHHYYIGMQKDTVEQNYDDAGALAQAQWRRVSDEDTKVIEDLFLANRNDNLNVFDGENFEGDDDLWQ